jgi:hypothetical protein
MEKGKKKREKRISNIEQGISNDEGKNTGSLPNACRDSGCAAFFVVNTYELGVTICGKTLKKSVDK